MWFMILNLKDKILTSVQFHHQIIEIFFYVHVFYFLI